MRILPQAMTDALLGSAADALLIVNIWYNGQAKFLNVPILSWSLDWDDSRAVMGQGRFTVWDQDGTMAPMSYDDPLSVAGGTVQVKLVSGGSSIDLALQRITRSEVDENWIMRNNSVTGKVFSTSGHIVTLETEDLTTAVSQNRFLIPETPPKNATVFSELRRVTQGVMDVVIDSALTDQSVPSSVVYKDDRMNTLQQLADALDAGMRVMGNGRLQVYARPTASQYTITGADHDANLGKLKRQAVYAGLYNGVVSTNTLTDGTVLMGTAFEQGGPLAWGGPHGKVPYFHNANFATTKSAINQDAATQLATIKRRRASTLPFTAKFSPAMETGDYITVNILLKDGTQYPLPATVSQVSMQGTSGIDATMSVRATVTYTDWAAAAFANSKKVVQ